MFEIKVIDEFCGAHNLRNYKGKCEALHGHNWKVEVCIYNKAVDSKGMVMDFKELKDKLKDILSGLDHKYLNTLLYFKKKNPTSENIAQFIYEKLSKAINAVRNRRFSNGVKKRIRVTVWETENSCASFEK